jgi:iron uptake system EfeUOB component EfeO/EfeM
MDTILRNILKKQNKDLLEKVATKYNLNIDEMLSKYHTPTFYGIEVNKDTIYRIKIKEVNPNPK